MVTGGYTWLYMVTSGGVKKMSKLGEIMKQFSPLMGNGHIHFHSVQIWLHIVTCVITHGCKWVCMATLLGHQVVTHKPRLHVPFKALRKPVYVKPISCKRTKAVSKPIWLNQRWFETGLKQFRHACKQLKRFKPLYKIQALTLPSLLFSKRSPSPIGSKPRSSHAGMSPTASKHEC